MLAKNLAQPPAGTVPDNRAANSFGGNESGPRCCVRLRVVQETDRKHIAAHGLPFRSNPPEFGIACQPSRFRQA